MSGSIRKAGKDVNLTGMNLIIIIEMVAIKYSLDQTGLGQMLVLTRCFKWFDEQDQSCSNRFSKIHLKNLMGEYEVME